MLVISEQVDIRGGTVDHAVGQQRIAASQCEAMAASRKQCDDRDLLVQVSDGHQAAAAVRNVGWRSCHACRMPAGR